MNELSLQVSKTINAPIEQVFDAWLDPAMLTQFILPMPGMAQPQVENDPVEGGRFTIVMQVGEDKIPHSGSYLTVDRPHHLVFSWESPFSVDGSQVSLQFSAATAGSTLVELTHVKFANEEACANHEGGWGNILEKLAELI